MYSDECTSVYAASCKKKHSKQFSDPVGVSIARDSRQSSPYEAQKSLISRSTTSRSRSRSNAPCTAERAPPPSRTCYWARAPRARGGPRHEYEHPRVHICKTATTPFASSIIIIIIIHRLDSSINTARALVRIGACCDLAR